MQRKQEVMTGIYKILPYFYMKQYEDNGNKYTRRTNINVGKPKEVILSSQPV